jgi:hypothetical protein
MRRGKSIGSLCFRSVNLFLCVNLKAYGKAMKATKLQKSFEKILEEE